MPPNDQAATPDLLQWIRELDAVGRDAPSRERQLELVAMIRSVSPEADHQLDQHLLERIARLLRGIKDAERAHQEMEQLFKRMTDPPWHLATYLGNGSSAARTPAAVVAIDGARRVVNVAEGVDLGAVGVGEEVLLNQERNLLVGFSRTTLVAAGDTAFFDRFTGPRTLVLRARDEEFVVEASDRLLRSEPKAGDLLRWDRSLWLALDKIERSAGSHLFLDETPRETFGCIGGLDVQIQALQRLIRMHVEHGPIAARYHLPRRAAVLLVGPPGTGKTLIARALANWLATLSQAGRSRFISVKPNSLSSMWFGQSEANYREIFRVARAAAEREPDIPVVMFFDEIDSIGTARGDTMTRVDDRVLTAFLAELDGLEARGNVLVVGATNRRDTLDPALLRPGGRLGDLVLEIPRPNRRAGREILTRHLPAEIPYLEEAGPTGDVRARLIDATVARLYGPNGLGEVASLMFRDGKRRAVRAADLVSGALLANIAKRATERACAREVESGAASGLGLTDLLEAATEEIATAARALTPTSCRRLLDSLPTDVDVVRVDRVESPTRHSHRYLSLG